MKIPDWVKRIVAPEEMDTIDRLRRGEVMFAKSVEADLIADEWTFRIIGPYQVSGGYFAIIPLGTRRPGSAASWPGPMAPHAPAGAAA